MRLVDPTGSWSPPFNDQKFRFRVFNGSNGNRISSRGFHTPRPSLALRNNSTQLPLISPRVLRVRLGADKSIPTHSPLKVYPTVILLEQPCGVPPQALLHDLKAPGVIVEVRRDVVHLPVQRYPRVVDGIVPRDFRGGDGPDGSPTPLREVARRSEEAVPIVQAEARFNTRLFPGTALVAAL